MTPDETKMTVEYGLAMLGLACSVLVGFMMFFGAMQRNVDDAVEAVEEHRASPVAGLANLLLWTILAVVALAVLGTLFVGGAGAITIAFEG